ncbi:hypothetical protein HQQ80_10315 [Microbacteriaceae bacterium VKM Ac-2855]|nr:hypothetical protein [Microbacteriaceae bacterium VKM Ac-2855]
MTNGFDIRIDTDAASAERSVVDALRADGYEVRADADGGYDVQRLYGGAIGLSGWEAEQFVPISFRLDFETAGDRIVARLRRAMLASVGDGLSSGLLQGQAAFEEAAVSIADALMQAGTYAGSDVL